MDRYLSPLSVVPLVTFTGLGLHYLAFPMVIFHLIRFLFEVVIYLGWVNVKTGNLWSWVWLAQNICQTCFSNEIATSSWKFR